MSPLLVIDTSTDRSAVALAMPDGSVRESPPEEGRRHGRGLVPAIRYLLRAEGLTPKELRTIAVGLGPGSFTGLRIGLTAAKTLSYVEGTPLLGLDSLEAVARSAPEEFSKISVVADAQRGDVYAADFARDGAGAPLRRLRPTRLEPISTWLKGLAEGAFVIGPALDRLKLDWPRRVERGEPSLGLPTGAGVVKTALEAAGETRVEDLWTLEPVYLRRSAAEEKRDDARPEHAQGGQGPTS